ncbi:unnamed protein product [Scytosiphon promiscuus]
MTGLLRSAVALTAAASAAAAVAATPVSLPEVQVHEGTPPRTLPGLPYYLDGRPENWQVRSYSPDVAIAPHTADGSGLTRATTGAPASFTVRLAGGPSAAAIRLAAENYDGGSGISGGSTREEQQHSGIDGVEGGEADEQSDWDYNLDKKRFIYVWVASRDNVFIAAVENNGDGTLTASYEAYFPGDYLVHVEDVDLRLKGDDFGRGRPITGSPFSLTVTGEPAIDVDALPVCGDANARTDNYDRIFGDGVESDGREELEDMESAFWRTGSWVSANVAAQSHGVQRDGWVFQPKTCAYEAFSRDDILLLAGLEEPTWLLAMGNSILRGVFLTLVDMALAEGQKDDFSTSVVKKCWGFIDIRIGNLRLSYQDLRLYTVTSVEDATVCNDEKLASGSTAAYVSSAELFLKDTIFREGGPWPTVVWAPSNMIDADEAPNLQISVLMDALPPSWTGTLVMMDHLYAYGYGWNTGNPTMATLRGVKPVNEFSPPTSDSGLARMDRYRQRDPRVTFMSAFPIYQARLFENERSRIGKRCYGCSIHYHFVSEGPDSPEAYGGAKMVHSAVTETLANIVLTKAVGSKEALYGRAATASATVEAGERRTDVGTVFELCTDCPASLIPLHVKPKPLLVCDITSALPGNATVGQAWDNELCPDWCMAQNPDREASQGAGLVEVRVCGGGMLEGSTVPALGSEAGDKP